LIFITPSYGTHRLRDHHAAIVKTARLAKASPGSSMIQKCDRRSGWKPACREVGETYGSALALSIESQRSNAAFFAKNHGRGSVSRKDRSHARLIVISFLQMVGGTGIEPVTLTMST
jgi:hypothetical protein